MHNTKAVRRRTRASLIWWIVILLAVGALTASAMFVNGYPVSHVELNDGGIWITSDQDGLFGRLNKPAGALDAAFYPPGGAQTAYQLDVIQDGAAIAAWDRASGTLMPVDVDRAAALGDAAAPIPSSDQVELDGGSLAVLDPSSGAVWAVHVDATAGITGLAGLGAPAKPLANVGKTAALAVAADGTVYAASASGRTVKLRPTASGGFTAPVYGNLGRTFTSVQATVVGGRLAVFDAAAGMLVVPGGVARNLGTNDAQALVQAPGPASSAVLIATSKVLLAVNLDTGDATTLWNKGSGTPAAPVRLAGCIHAAWAGTSNGYVRSCDGAPAAPGGLTDASALVHPVFRVNRGAIVLNDMATGAVWDLATDHRVDDWDAGRPPPLSKPSTTKKDNTNSNQASALPPKAVDDALGARTGRTTMLHVLDNDSDPSGRILSVRSVDQPDSGKAHTSISPDGQTIAVSVPSRSPDLHFKYTIDDGAGHTSSASVTVQIRGPNDNKQPNLRAGAKPPVYTVPAGGHLRMPVLTDWRDFDGDPLVLAGASADNGGEATATADGYVDFTAPAKGGTVTVKFQVSDGVGAPVSASTTVTVQSPSATTAVAAIVEPDVARGEVGRPIVIAPLDNDLPGSDPTNSSAVLRLAANVATPSGTTVATDLHAGTVTVVASRPGTYVLDYTVAFGNAPFAKSQIRVDVAPDPANPAPPVAMPDIAILHGQVPATVDVLANDYDPAGDVLVVEQARPVDTARLSVAVIAGHWLRISALAPVISPDPQIVRYTITDGVTGPVTGEVSVTQVSDDGVDTLAPVDDYVTVRAGDAATVPVLDNDADTSGAPLSLAADVVGAPAPGRLAVRAVNGSTSDIGSAYVDGNFVRYVPPAQVVSAEQATVDYVAQDPSGNQARGQLHVTIEPAPSKADPNSAPEPSDVTARVVAGDTAVITVPTSGVDPDGDSVSLTGIGSGPKLGRILAMSATSLTYQAFPASAGTDDFTYLVTDRYGGVATASIQVGVVQPGDPQPPVAVDDTVTAAPGAHVDVDIVANDLFSPDDAVSVTPLAPLNPDLPTGTTLSGASGPLSASAPANDGKPEVITYGVTDGIGEPSIATVTIRSQAGYDAPPVTTEAYATRNGVALTASVNVLSGVTDPDGPSSGLKVSAVYGAGVRVAPDGTLTAPVSGLPYVVAYQVTDSGHASALGIVHVPGSGAAGPYAKPGQLIQVPRNGSTTIQLTDYVIDPAGKAVRLTTTEQIVASPSAGLKVAAKGVGSLRLTGAAAYVGPGAITFQVTDGTSLTDPNGRTAVITIPVQIGPETPVMRCPTDPIDLIEGGATVTINVASVCHVWTADPATLPALRFTGDWAKPVGNVTLTGSGTGALSLTASGSAVPGATGTLRIGIAGSDATPATLTVRVLSAAPPSVRPITVDGAKAGQTAVVDLASYTRSELRDPQISVVSASELSGEPATIQPSGATVRITPATASHGTIVFSVVVTDVAGSRPDRMATGQITLHVLGRPDAPGTPVVGRTVLSESVQLSWTTPANNGAPITSYMVTYSGGQQTCAASPCLITGLHNGTAYRFRVQAVNVVGSGQPSGESDPATPNEVPPAVTDLVVSDPTDGSLRISWKLPAFDGTAVQTYNVTWTGGGHEAVGGNSTTANPTGLDNDTSYTFSITAINALGPGPTATVTGQSAGTPPTPHAPTFRSANSADHTTRAVTVSWDADDPNGPGPTKYTLQRSGGSGAVTVCAAVTATSCVDDGIGNDGTTYTYRVTATNADGQTSQPSPGTSIVAATTPEPITNFSATATGNDGQATIHFDAPRSNGASSTVTCTRGGANCGTWTFPTGGQSGVTETVTGLSNGVDSTLSLQDCNGSSGAGADNPCDASVNADVVAYGPLGQPSVSTSVSGTSVSFTVKVDPNGKAATVKVQTSKQSQTFTTGVGSWSWSGSDNVGYSSTDTISVTVSDSGRTSTSTSAQATTGAAPPPPPSITASQGVQGSPTVGACNDSSCHWLNFEVHNFPTGSFTWKCSDQDGVYFTSTSKIRITNPNQSFDGNTTYCNFGSGETISIIIDGYQSNAVPHS